VYHPSWVSLICSQGQKREKKLKKPATALGSDEKEENSAFEGGKLWFNF